MQRARACYDRCRAQGHVSVSDVEAALREFIAEEQDLSYLQWHTLADLGAVFSSAVREGPSRYVPGSM
ncbi:MAG: hypothetical protein RBU27_08085 [Bacteroidota bacterium]|nr:hypothetical protein [Bacteroidota bacterium]